MLNQFPPRRPASTFLLCLLSISLLLFPVVAEAADGKVVLTGSSTMAPLLAEIGKRFESRHPGIRIDVQTGGSSRGMADVAAGLADIGMVSRALKPQEQHLHGSVIAYDGITIILHATNPVQELSHDHIRSIYRGVVTNWKVLGGPDALITVVNKAQGRSTLELFLDYFHLSNRDIQAHVIIGDNEQGIKTVAGNPHAIGYVSTGTAQHDATRGIPIRLVPLAGIPATLETVWDDTFPLSRPLTLVTQPDAAGLITTFIDFAQSPEVHDLILNEYFVPIQH
jgi:phosphate transport system substrate-binding protein